MFQWLHYIAALTSLPLSPHPFHFELISSQSIVRNTASKYTGILRYHSVIRWHFIHHALCRCKFIEIFIGKFSGVILYGKYAVEICTGDQVGALSTLENRIVDYESKEWRPVWTVLSYWIHFHNWFYAIYSRMHESLMTTFTFFADVGVTALWLNIHCQNSKFNTNVHRKLNTYLFKIYFKL